MVSKTEGTGTTQYVWDFENRLVQVVTPAGGSVTYKYDALGRRIQRTPSSGISTNFIYDGPDVVKDINSDGSTIEYLNGPGIDNKIRQKGSSTSTTYYFSQDHLGSTTALTGTTGKLVERITYDGYGNSAGSTRTRYGYTGRERDPLTGLLYYRARWYEAPVGRFISEDPIGLDGGDINLYTYVQNDPLGYSDPSGLERLSYTLIPGKPAPPIRTNPARLPDFYKFEINLGPPATPINWSGQFIIDRHGRMYLQPIGLGLGKSFPAGGSVAIAFGWVNQRCEPDQETLNNILSDQSLSVGGGFFVGGELSGNQSGSTTQIGVYTPQIGGSWGYTRPIKDTGIEQSHFTLNCDCP